MNNQNLAHNVTPIAIIAPATKKAGPSFGGTAVVCQAFWSAIKALADLRLCHYRMSKREGCGSVGDFNY